MLIENQLLKEQIEENQNKFRLIEQTRTELIENLQTQVQQAKEKEKALAAKP
jgi:hypothetical protein